MPQPGYDPPPPDLPVTMLTFDRQFVWNTGKMPLRWYRVEGNCQFPGKAGGTVNGAHQPGGCDVTGIQTDLGCTGMQKFVHNLLARNVAEICTQMRDSRLNWKITSLKRWTRPADGRLVAAGDHCNSLEEIPFTSLSSCLQLASTDAVVHMSISVTAAVVFPYTGSGGVVLGGTAPTSTTGTHSFAAGHGNVTALSDVYALSDPEPSISTSEMTVTVEGLEVIFGSGAPAGALLAPPDTVSTTCGACSSMPLTLNLSCGLIRDGIFFDFLKRNGFELPPELVLHYSSSTGSWLASRHFCGSGIQGNEMWTAVFEWACVSEFGGDELGASCWKFSLHVTRKATTSSCSRILVLFPPTEICSGTNNFDFDFQFSANVVTHFVSAPAVASSVIFADGAAIFKSRGWTSNPNLEIRVASRADLNAVSRQDISGIFPAKLS